MATAREIVEDAYRMNGVLAFGESMSAEHGDFGLRRMNGLLEAWGLNPAYSQKLTDIAASVSSQTFTVGDGLNFDTGVFTPVRIESAFYRVGATDWQLVVLDTASYDKIPDKTYTSTHPRYVYLDRQGVTSVGYLYPVPSSAISLHLRLCLTYNFADLNADIDLPPGMQDALALTLAERLAVGEAKISQELASEARKARDAFRLSNHRTAQLEVGGATEFDIVSGSFL